MLLMHKDKIVAELSMRGSVIAGVNVVDMDEMPIGVDRRPALTLNSLNKWMHGRSIPQERQGISAIEKALGCSISDAAIKAMAVSLTDCYWIQENDSSLRWKDVNYHDNSFPELLFDVVVKHEEVEISDFRLPDITTDGALEKTWVHSNNIPILLKRGQTLDCKQNLLSANEVVVSEIASRLGFACAEYFPRVVNTREIVCASPCFVRNIGDEYVSAYQIQNQYRIFRKDLYDWFVSRGFEKEMKDMLYLDHLAHNTDRHEKNFGVIRSAESGNILRMAPIFDSGSCLDWNGLGNSYQYDAKPFFDDRYEQLKLLSSEDVKDRHSLPLEMLTTIIHDIYEQFGIPGRQTENAIRCISSSYFELSEIAKN